MPGGDDLPAVAAAGNMQTTPSGAMTTPSPKGGIPRTPSSTELLARHVASEAAALPSSIRSVASRSATREQRARVAWCCGLTGYPLAGVVASVALALLYLPAQPVQSIGRRSGEILYGVAAAAAIRYYAADEHMQAPAACFLC